MPAGPSSPNPHRETDRANRAVDQLNIRSIPFGPTPSRPEKSAPLLDPALPRLCNTGKIAHSLTNSPSGTSPCAQHPKPSSWQPAGWHRLLPAWRQPTLAAQDVAPLPAGVQVAWDLENAYRQSTPTREQICINGLWRWQPASEDTAAVPQADWGHFKVPGSWPGITDYMQKDCQTVFAHPSWADKRLGEHHLGLVPARDHRPPGVDRPPDRARRRLRQFLRRGLYRRNQGRRDPLSGRRGRSDHRRAGRASKHVLSILVDAMPLKAVMLSYSDTASAKQVKGSVARRGLCGDVYLASTPAGAQHPRREGRNLRPQSQDHLRHGPGRPRRR